MNSQARFCQLKCLLVFALVVASCASKDKDYSGGQDRDKEISEIRASWFQTKFPYSRTFKGEIGEHPFFDPSVYLDVENKEVRYYPLTLKDSGSEKKFDLRTGSIYKAAQLCTHKDAWNSYTNRLRAPNFTLGILPRKLDAQGNPQKIVIFHNKKIRRPSKNYPYARVVGSILKQECDNAYCINYNKWKSYRVIIAVDSESEQLKKYNELADLMQSREWGYAAAYIQNNAGQKFIKGQLQSLGRIIKPENAVNTLKYILYGAKTFETEKIITLRRSCEELYDNLWLNVGNFHINFDSQKSRSKSFENFAHNFKNFYRNYRSQMHTCLKYVSPTNGTLKGKREWFSNNVLAFFLLESQGYTYDCSNGFWYKSPYKNKQGLALKDVILRCPSKILLKAFDSVIGTWDYLYSQNLTHYRFVKKVNGRKVNSWVRMDTKPLECVSKAEAFSYEIGDKRLKLENILGL